jgi:peroxiredoxin Q/BCP
MEIGDKVPETSVRNQDDQPVSLKDFRGKPVVLFFFPKADTPG